MGRWGWDRVGEQGMDRQGLEEGCDLDGWVEENDWFYMWKRSFREGGVMVWKMEPKEFKHKVDQKRVQLKQRDTSLEQE